MKDRLKRIGDVILCVFETDQKIPEYGAMATMRDGPAGVRQITYGYHQGTHSSGTLRAIVNEYLLLGGQIEAPKALSDLTPTACAALAANEAFKQTLRRAAADPLMQEAQRRVFSKRYMQPALDAFGGSGWVHPLSFVTILDSMVHGSYGRIRDGVPADLPELEWIKTYLQRRYNWLSAQPKVLLKNTRCRVKSLSRLLDNPDLITPFILDMTPERGKTPIVEEDLDAF